MEPEQVEEEARRRAAERGYPDLPGAEPPGSERPTIESLRRWAFLEIDPREIVYSTRKLGGPITAVKQALARGLRQYHNELTSQVTRFNVHLLAYVDLLEQRVKELESEVERMRDRSG